MYYCTKSICMTYTSIFYTVCWTQHCSGSTAILDDCRCDAVCLSLWVCVSPGGPYMLLAALAELCTPAVSSAWPVLPRPVPWCSISLLVAC